MVKNIALPLVLCTSFYAFSMEQQAPVFSTYQGKQLTPTSIPSLAPQFPQEDSPVIKAWLQESPNNKTTTRQEIIRDLITLPTTLEGEKGGLGTQHKLLREQLKNIGMLNLSAWNYIFDSGKYVIKLPGRINRVQNLLVYNDPNPDKPTLQDDETIKCDDAIKNRAQTYQGTSVMAGYLRGVEAINHFNLSAFILPKTYILGIDGSRAPQEVNDENSIIVQEKIYDTIPLSKLSLQERRAKITPEILKQLLKLTIYAGLWELQGNLLVSQSNGKLVYTDWEQPNNSNPIDFYHKRLGKILHQNIPCGISQICKLFKDTSLQPSGDAINNVCDEFANLKDEGLVAIGSFNG